MDPELQQLATVFQATLSPDKDAIKAAEQQLKAAAQQPGYCIKVLKLTATPIDDAIRQSAAVNFKNVIKYRWDNLAMAAIKFLNTIAKGVFANLFQEFHPYVFQIFSQLIELRPAPLPQLYLAIFPPLLSPVFWERSGNVPALVRLLQAYLTKAGTEVVAGGHLAAVLGVFQKLLSSKAHDHEGFYIVNAIVESLPLPAYAQFLPSIWTLMFQRLSSSKTPKFCRFFVVFLALFICKHGPAAAAEQLDKVQPGILFMLLGQVWLPALPGVDGPEEEKLVAVAGAKLLTELPGFNAAAPGDRGALWAALRKGVVDKLTGGGSQGGSGQEDEEPDFEEMQGYTAAYAKLANAAKTERPVLAEIPDPRQYVEAALARVGAATSAQGPPAKAAAVAAACSYA
eukprot:XP_001692097.1 cellular apoptosis susceptibility protein [Chlamydomonas reinhardtii]